MAFRVRYLLASFDGWPMRTRLLVTGASAAIIVFAVDVFVQTPQVRRQAAMKTELAAQKTQLEDVQRRTTEINRRIAEDVSSIERAERDRLRRSVGEIEPFMQKIEASSPPIGSLLRQVIAQSSGLTLVSLKSLPVTAVLQAQAAQAPAAGAAATPKPEPQKPAAAQSAGESIYSHAVQVTLRGDWASLMRFIGQLESFPKPLLWRDLVLRAEEYPTCLLEFSVSILSKSAEPSYR